MRQVRTCDFCGADATGIFEPLPASFPDAPRMLLCDECRDTLASVVDPLLAAIEGEVALGAGRSERPTPSGGSSDAGAERTGDVSTERRTAWPDQPEEDAALPSSDAPTRGGASSGDAASGSSETPTGGAEVGESRDASGRSQRERAGTPHGYRKVMRFLENRPLPIEREEAERMVVDAYEMDEAAVAKVVDHAVQYGRLREVSGELRR